jgi:regulator of protease activity HflC (stomatin/prohibitin superfamily)
MKKIISVLSVVLALFYLSGCDNVKAGYVGVKVEKYGDTRGVKSEVLGPGRYWTGINTDIFEFPTFSQNEIWAKKGEKDESITFQSREGTSINADFGMTYHIKRESVPLVFEKYRRGVDEISDIFLRNIVRDSLNDIASRKTLDELMNEKVEFMDAVNKDVIARAGASGITVESVATVGEFRWPPQIIAAMNAKMTATQEAMRVENEVRRTKAEAEKDIVKAEASVRVARAEAQAVELRGQALAKNPQVLQQMAIEKWDGKLPQVSGGATPFINLK